jgi:hypothetical protein
MNVKVPCTLQCPGLITHRTLRFHRSLGNPALDSKDFIMKREGAS